MADFIFLLMLLIVGIAVLLTLVSNIYTCAVFFSSKILRSRTKLLLGNIAVSDIIFIIGFIFPFFIINPFVVSAVSGVLVQSLFNYINAVTCYAQSITMTVISYDRFYMIVKPLSDNPIDKLGSKSLISLIWILSLTLSLPFMVSFNVYSYNYDIMAMQCSHQEHWLIMSATLESFSFRLIIYITRFLLQYLLPIILTAYNYVHICVCLWSRSRVRCSRGDSETIKTIKMLIAVVLVFAVFNLGFHINIFTSFSGGDCAVKASDRLSHLFYAMFVITTTINPFIYWWTCDSFREDFKRVIQSMTPFRQCICAYHSLAGKADCDKQTKTDEIESSIHNNELFIATESSEN